MQQHRNVQSDSKLSAQLDAYTASVRANRGAAWKERLAGWAPYAAAIGSGLAMASAADADVIYSGPNKNVMASEFGTGHHTKFAAFTGAGVSFGLYARGVNYGDLKANSVKFAGAAVNELVAPAGFFVIRLGSGANISMAGAFGASRGIETRTATPSGGGMVGNFPPPTTGFVGVSFKVASQTDYGWIRLKVTDGGAGDGYPHKVTAVDWAYENDGGAILAGQTQESSAVPEPSTIALALLASGAAGVLAWRKRRQAVAAASI
jgi:hypothetical protein